MPSAYQSRPYDDRYSSARMGDLIRDAGAVEAQGIQQRGQAWAGTVGRMGDLITGVAGAWVAAKGEVKKQAEADKVKAEQTRIADAIKASTDPATGRLDFEAAGKAIGQFNPLEAEKYWEKADDKKRRAAEDEAKKAEEFASGLKTILMASQQDEQAGPGALQQTPRLWRAFREGAIAKKLPGADTLPEEYDEAAVQASAIQAFTAHSFMQQLFSAKNAPKLHPVVTPGPDGNPMHTLKTEAELRAGVPGMPPANADRPATAVVDGRIVNTRNGEVIYTSPDAGKGKDNGPKPAAIQRARDNRFNRMATLREKVDKGMDAAKAELEAYEIEREYAAATGGPEPTMPRQAPNDIVASGTPTADDPLANRTGTMRDMLLPQRTGAPAGPMGRGTASAAPASPAAKGPVTITLPNGKPKTFKSQFDLEAFAKKYNLRVK